ncbi:MAG: methyltransferase domain-containing protein [Eubacteriales bacterium]|nr:methyltransferase domain-containing protein [Eubacteriales bacterium]
MVKDKSGILICPVCRKKLNKSDNALVCEIGHSFDISRRGYVNLITGNGKNHGDNKEMILARDSFLSSGAYSHLANAIINSLAGRLPKDKENIIIDSGCGSGYYTDLIEKGLDALNIPHSIYAYDVSKDAIQCTARKNQKTDLCVASVSSMPYADGCADAIVCVFSPLNIPEFLRVLKPGGLFIEAIPNPEHLIELKKVIYDNPYKNTVSENNLDGFDFLCETNAKRTLNLNLQEAENLFAMTPYFYRTNNEGRERLKALSSISVSADFKILTFSKR